MLSNYDKEPKFKKGYIFDKKIFFEDEFVLPGLLTENLP